MARDINKLEFLQDYMVTYSKSRKGKKSHYSQAELIIKGYKVTIKPEYYETMEEAVQGIKDRITQALKDFEL